ncbi:hypothetical protein [Brachybacterium huguangmaarense]
MTPVPPRPRILLVDDDATIREHLRPVLERSGLDVATAVDGAGPSTRSRGADRISWSSTSSCR